MDILPKVNKIKTIGASRVSNTILLRPIENPIVNTVKKSEPMLLPSFRKAKLATETTEKTGKKRGRPSKEEKLKKKLERASSRIRDLVEGEPSKADIYNYFEDRIEELNTPESDSD